MTATYLINRTPTRLLKRKILYELIYGAPLTYDNLRVFGCLAFAHNQQRGGDKFESRSMRCLFVGYPFAKKGWSLFDLETEENFVSRGVVFMEDVFPLKHELHADSSDPNLNSPCDFGLFDDELATSQNAATSDRAEHIEDVTQGV